MSIGIESIGQAIEEKITSIDSLSINTDNNKQLVEGIAEGPIMNKRNKTIGGFSTYDLKDNSDENRNLYRIRHYVSTDHYYKTTFYYHDKKLIKASVIIEDWKSDNSVSTIYSALYYFDNDSLIKADREDKKYSNSVDILELGQRFQKDFYKDKTKE